MKSFIWRMRSNVIYFLAAMVVFTVVYIIMIYTSIREFTSIINGAHCIECLDYADPSIVSAFVSFAFFFICQRRYTYDEDYIYGTSRKCAYSSSIASSLLYAFIFSCYCMGLALFVRRDILSMNNLAVSKDLYSLSAWDIFAAFAFLFTINSAAYEVANILRKFRSWRFWLTIGVSVVMCIALAIVIGSQRLDYWVLMFAIFVPLLFIMIGGDYFMTRGRQYR